MKRWENPKFQNFHKHKNLYNFMYIISILMEAVEVTLIDIIYLVHIVF